MSVPRHDVLPAVVGGVLDLGAGAVDLDRIVEPAPHQVVVAPKIARDFVTSLLGVSRHLRLVDDARLCVTEIVTNAHRHSGTRLIRVHVTVNRKRVTVCVADENPWALPVPGAPAPAVDVEREKGQGLLLVARLAVAWGATIYGGCSPTHKAVWFTPAGSETADM
ncbi:ATP-binding protein [Streptomyces sp. NPDC050509]|uniref:ATP-binding protein n=1 Tax=Streptomyces sp. NPDC050509 TaxID=3365620 RepID=UPI0037AE85CD